VSEMLRGSPEDEFDEELSEVDELEGPSLEETLVAMTTSGESMEDESVEFERFVWLDSCMRTEKR